MNSDKTGDFHDDGEDFLELGDEIDFLTLTLVAFQNFTRFVILRRMRVMSVMVILAYSVLLTGIKG